VRKCKVESESVPTVSGYIQGVSGGTCLGLETALLNSEINSTRCNNCVYSSQWFNSTCFGWQFHPSSGVQCCIWPFR